MDRPRKIALVFLLVVLFVVFQVRSHAVQEEQPMTVNVVRVVDGDTLIVQWGRQERRVRVIGINAPELKGDECYSREAAEVLGGLVGGRQVRIVREVGVQKDEYGRYLRYVEVGGRDVGELLVVNGFARVLEVQSFGRVKAYRRAEGSARHAKRGLWGACVGV